jgi:hypothetical protein
MQETVTLVSPGPLPGIPGASHGPGTFLVDYDARTATEILPAPQAGEASGQDAETSGAIEGRTPPAPETVAGQTAGE